MSSCLFGPVPSRRLGMSLGVDLVPRKVCSLDCVYCEVGATTHLTIDREEYVPFDTITRELTDYFAGEPDPDFITFSGSGEPTLNSRMREVIDFIRRLRPGIPIALLTNGTLLYDPDVRSAIRTADLVLPSLDAATERVFKAINRPPPTLSLNRILQGLVDFRNEFIGEIWLEVLILPGFNDHDDEVMALRDAVVEIRPDVVQLNTLDRPGTVSGLRGATQAELRRVVDLWGLANVEIIAAAPHRKKLKAYRKDAETAILQTIARRPCTIEDLTQILGMQGAEINKYLDVLDAENRIEAIRQDRGLFYQTKESLR